jgi:hypothetical protein
MKLCSKVNLAMALLALAALSASSAELAILENGFAIRHVRHEQREGLTRLYISETPSSYVDVPTYEIVRFEELGEVTDPSTSTTEPKSTAQPSPGGASSATTTLDGVIRAAGSRNGIDPDLIASIIRAESGFHPEALSPKGAQGLMQLMPGTAARLGVENPIDPVANVQAGTRYLVELLARYDDDLIKALAAYNAGPKRVGQYHGVPPYTETRAYIAKVVGDFNHTKLTEGHAEADHGDKPGVAKNSRSVAPTLPMRTSRVQPLPVP